MIIGLLVGSTFLLIGIFVLFWNEKKRMLADVACNWPVAIGRICESRVHYARPRTDESDCLVFSYEYEVDGVSHTGKSIDLFGLENRTTGEEMEEVVHAYPQGAQVKIHYDANNPSVSVIDPDHRLAYFRNRYLGAMLTFLGIVIVSGMKFA
jgi:hypothetical protein